MDITLLPEHIFIDVTKYLSTNDLLSCSLVNTSWRNAINCNDIWRYVCKNVMISNTGEELDHIPKLVSGCKSPYSAPDFENLCKWRETFMRWQRMKDNWRRGNFRQFPISEEVSTFCDVECDDSSVLIVQNDLRELSVWNIKLVPYHEKNIKFCLNHVCSEFVKLYNNYLIIVQCNLLQIFHYTDDGFVLYFRCIFNEPESYSKQIPVDYNLTDWYCSKIDLYPCDLTVRCEHNGNHFIGAILDGDYNETVLHIWDLNKKIKNTEVPIPWTPDVVSDVEISVSDDCMYLIIKNFGSSSYYNSIFLYDLKTFKFLDFKIQFSYIIPAFIVYKNIFFAIDDLRSCINIWKVKSKYNKVLECNFEIDLNCFNVESYHLLIGGKQQSNQSTVIVVYHLSDFKCVFTTTVQHKVSFISLIQNSFLILGDISRFQFLSVIDLSKDCVLYGIEGDDCMFISSTHSKLITRADNELIVINYW